jgi:hypothetical protein
MVNFLQVFAALEFAGGILVLFSAKGAIHEILGALGIGFAVMTLALSGILQELQKNSEILQRQLTTTRVNRTAKENKSEQRPEPEQSAPGNEGTYRGYQYVRCRDGTIDLRLPTGRLRKFATDDDLRAFVDDYY